MEIVIDLQRVINVEAEAHLVEGEEVVVLGIQAVNDLLGAWIELDPKRRWYSWPATRDNEDMVIAWFSETAGLVGEWVSPFYDGVAEHDAHSLQAISSALPDGTLAWGADLEVIEPKED